MGADNFQKGKQLSSCSHCGVKGEHIFNLVRYDLKKVNASNLALRLSGQNHRAMVVDSTAIEPLHTRLQKNIFEEFDKTGSYILEEQRTWEQRLRGLRNKNSESHEGLLEVMHFLGDKDKYNILIHSLPIYDESLSQFFAKCYQGVSYNAPTAEPVRKRLGTTQWFTDITKDEGIANITRVIQDQFSAQRVVVRQHEITEMAISIYTSLSTRGGNPKPEDWEANYATNSPLSVLKPKLLKDQFKLEHFYEGIEYCSYCGSEQSRSLRYNGKFVAFEGAEKEIESVIEYDGRIQDLESEVLPQVKIMWQEQIKEFKRRDKKAIKLWDSAEDRLQKKLDKEKERIRQEEIAELESKLKKLQNGD